MKNPERTTLGDLAERLAKLWKSPALEQAKKTAAPYVAKALAETQRGAGAAERQEIVWPQRAGRLSATHERPCSPGPSQIASVRVLALPAFVRQFERHAVHHAPVFPHRHVDAGSPLRIDSNYRLRHVVGVFAPVLGYGGSRRP